MSPLKITFHLDGSGVAYDPAAPLHLDALLAWCLAPMHCKGDAPSRDETPMDIPLPIARWHMGGTWGWHASALFPEGITADGLRAWRKKFRQHRAELAAGTPNLQNATYREYNMPLPLLLCTSMTAYAMGKRSRVHQLCRRIKYLGKKRSQGHGVVVGVETEIIGEDFSLIRDGKAMRFLPCDSGTRFLRVRPPYWNRHERINVCEIGQTL